jgi:hypothetical protein
VSYESVSPNLLLGPGSYFALFDNQQPGVTGYILGSALLPFFYNSGASLTAQVNTITGDTTIIVPPPFPVSIAAVRVLGETVPEPSAFLLLGAGLIALAAVRGICRTGITRVS